MLMKRPPLCIYHGPSCTDGFGSAWVVNKYYREHTDVDNVEFHVGKYGEPIPDVDGRLVYIVDFSYSLEMTKEIIERAEFTVVLDHHKTALNNLESLSPSGINYHILLDMNRSGAMLTWDYFFDDVPPPALIKHVQDRDLWQFKYPETEAVMAAVYSHPFEFSIWDELNTMPVENLVLEGQSLLRKQAKDLAVFIPLTKRPVTIAGHTVEMVNLPPSLASDAGNILAKENLFGAVYFDTVDYRQFSLRSIKGGFDVESVAAQYGGGGHATSAGFIVPRDHELAKI